MLQYRTSDYLFAKALDGIAESDLYRRPTSVTNHMLWIAGHMADTRVLSLRALHATFDLPWGDCFQRGCEVRADSEYPSIATVADILKTEGTRLSELLASVPDERLMQPATGVGVPRAQTLLDEITMVAWHEAYHLGQLGYVRKALGYSALAG
jgi:hypothetical protein